jgi:hypothetical protein
MRNSVCSSILHRPGEGIRELLILRIDEVAARSENQLAADLKKCERTLDEIAGYNAFRAGGSQ